MRVHIHTFDEIGHRVKITRDLFSSKEYSSLIERFARLLAPGTEDRDWEESKHPRASNGQFGHGGFSKTGGEHLGEKPTSHTAKGVKAGVHQLLTSGHSFSLAELQAATGAKLTQQIHNAISELKKQTMAGGLYIDKDPKTGLYSIKKKEAAGEPAPAPAPAPVPVPKPAPPVAAPSPAPAPPPAAPIAKGKVPKWEPQKTNKAAAALAIKNGYAKHVDFGKLPVEISNAHMDSLAEHINEFPELRKHTDFAGSGQALVKKLKADKEAEVIAGLRERRPELFEPGNEDRLKMNIKWNVGRTLKVPGKCWAFATRGHHGAKAVCFNERADPLARVKVWSKDPVTGRYEYGPDGKMAYKNSDRTQLDQNVESGFHPVGCNTAKSIADHEYGHQLDFMLGLSNNSEVMDLERDAKMQARSAGVGAVLSKYGFTNRAEFIAEAWAEAKNNPNPRPVAAKMAEIIRRVYAKTYPA